MFPRPGDTRTPATINIWGAKYPNSTLFSSRPASLTGGRLDFRPALTVNMSGEFT